MNEYHGMASNKLTMSKINTYIMCQAKHYFAYIEKVKAPSRSALLKGIAFHSAVETNYVQKIETEKDLPVSDDLDILCKNLTGTTDIPGMTGANAALVLLELQKTIEQRKT